MKYMTFLPLVLLLSVMDSRSQSKTLDSSISEYERYVINNVEHSVFIKGRNKENPLLLILHGGPGFSDFFFWQTHNKALEEKFTVVTYDQRGTGLSYNDSIPQSSLTFSQLENDALVLINLLKERFKKKKVFLIGFSAGTITGINLVKNNPKLFTAFISVGQVVNGYLNEKVSLEYSIKKATELNDTAALSDLLELRKRYPSNKNKNELSDLFLSRKWLRKFNGDFCEGTSVNELYMNIDQEVKKYYNNALIEKGQSFSMKAMWDEVAQINLFETVTKIKVPIYFIAGRCDFNVPSNIAFDYFEKLKAPSKKFIWFENSGHYAPFIEANKFNNLLMTEVLSIDN